MAIRVTPARGMNGISTKTFENATTYKLDGSRLDIYAGSKRIGSYAGGCWEAVEVVKLLDQKADTSLRLHGEDTTPTTKTRNGDQIRTSPHKKGARKMPNRQDGKNR